MDIADFRKRINRIAGYNPDILEGMLTTDISSRREAVGALDAYEAATDDEGRSRARATFVRAVEKSRDALILFSAVRSRMEDDAKAMEVSGDPAAKERASILREYAMSFAPMHAGSH